MKTKTETSLEEIARTGHLDGTHDLPAEVLEQMNKENWASLKSQQQYWKDKETVSDNATRETRGVDWEALAISRYERMTELWHTLSDIELRCTQDTIASGIGKRKNQTEFLLGALDRIRNVARTAIGASNLSKLASTTAETSTQIKPDNVTNETREVIPPAVKLALRIVLNHVEPGWGNSVTVLKQWLDPSQSSTEISDDLSRTESACDWFDHQIEGKEWSLREDGRSDGQGESYAERNL